MLGIAQNGPTDNNNGKLTEGGYHAAGCDTKAHSMHMQLVDDITIS
jgi:hypothetical protein